MRLKKLRAYHDNNKLSGKRTNQGERTLLQKGDINQNNKSCVKSFHMKNLKISLFHD